MEQHNERRPDDNATQCLPLSSPAPFLRPPMAGGATRSGATPRTPRLGLAIPPSPNQKPVNQPGLVPDLPSHQALPPVAQVSRSRPTPPQLRLATPFGSHSTPPEQPLPQANRPSTVPQGTTGSLGSEGSARSRADSFTVIDGRGSNPTSASSGFSGQRHLAGTPDPASAISSVYSEIGTSIEKENSHHTLPDLAKLSLEKGHELEPEDLDNDGWKAANEQKKIEELGSLGEGAGGAVTRCRLVGGKKEFALKLLTADPNPEMKKQLYRELSFNRDCNSEYICKYYGFFDDSTGATGLAMEYCAGGSLHSVYQEVKRLGGRTGERVLGKIAEGVLHGLTYLHSQHIIHRDIKPGNILLTRQGQVRLCDFGVSGQSGTKGDASTFIGTSYYMAPERITGQSYTITSDVWSLGVTLLEVAQHRFPFPADGTEIQPKSGLIDLLTYIVGQEIPKLKDEPEDANGEGGIVWSPNFKYFIECCLEKEASRRGTPWRMLEHPWMVDVRPRNVNVAHFLAQVWDWRD